VGALESAASFQNQQKASVFYSSNTSLFGINKSCLVKIGFGLVIAWV